ncbi:AfsR/SARP family transcriptional regulator [Actinocorallia libanotica]|uniref:AfsR/SARP family transcriptional regulator n=1 Tax=Actinocorallia libanotica TaxID=46162 RepID=A0ABP4BPA2_9ACTN
MGFQLLGSVRIVDATGTAHTVSAPKVGALLATLLIRAGEPVSTEELMEELWGSGPPRRARAALHVYISQLRKHLLEAGGDQGRIGTRGAGYVMDVDPAAIDAARLQELHARGRRAASAGDPERALACFEEAAALFRGPVLAREANGQIVGAFARWAEEVRLECLEALADCSLRTGREREVIGDLLVWVRERPLHETFREQLMLALYRSGRRAEALEAYRDARRVFREELGLDPRISMRQLQNAILQGESLHALPLADAV